MQPSRRKTISSMERGFRGKKAVVNQNIFWTKKVLLYSKTLYELHKNLRNALINYLRQNSSHHFVIRSNYLIRQQSHAFLIVIFKQHKVIFIRALAIPKNNNSNRALFIWSECRLDSFLTHRKAGM
jgi:hypothetical protein